MKQKMTYRILYVEKAEALNRPGLVFNSQLSAEDHVKKISQESPNFHFWIEPMPAPQEAPKAEEGQTAL